MRRVRGVVHGPAAGLTAPQEGGRPAREAPLDRAATPRPFFLPLFTQPRSLLEFSEGGVATVRWGMRGGS